MFDQKQITNEIVGMAKATIETGIRNMEIAQQQTEKVMNLTVDNAVLIQNESRKNLENLIGGMKKAQQLYRDTISESFATWGKKVG